MADTGWMEEYRETEDVNQKYRLLREEVTQLRQQAQDKRFTDNDEVMELLREQNAKFEGELLVFAANDFGYPVALRPAGTSLDVQEAVREEILQEKYKDNPELDTVRQQLLDADARIHKALVVHHDGGSIDYHLPGGRNENTNFLTVREAVGLVDYVTNSAQRDGLSKQYG